jgi:hypothetical protein
MSDKITDFGIKILHAKASQEELSLFLSQCITADPDIIYSEDQEDAAKYTSWSTYAYELDINDFMNNWGYEQCDLYYANDDGFAQHLDTKDVLCVHMLFMPDYGSRYRIVVWETTDHYLFLGKNHSD